MTDNQSALAGVSSQLILFEDPHLLVVSKPAGINTHSPAPYAGEGLYDWLRHRDPRWASLAVMQRLDKETSGVLLFAKTSLANRSLTKQFTEHTVRKRYLLLSDRAPGQSQLQVNSHIVRMGERYVSRSLAPTNTRAETHFRVVSTDGGRTLVEAEPVTGRTHQIRVHAADNGFPILGDTLYGGTHWPRVCLHAVSLAVAHPETGEPITFIVEPGFERDPRLALRERMIDCEQTNAFRATHGGGDGQPGHYVDQLGEYLLIQSEEEPRADQPEGAAGTGSCRGVYYKRLSRRIRGAQPAEASPRLIHGQEAPDRFVVRENGLSFELSFREGYSTGLFLDQRDNRRRFLLGHVAAAFPLFAGQSPGREILNTFAYTCGFSVSAAAGGARTTSVDLSKKYLEWGRRNFSLNGLDPKAHDFIHGDVFEWLKRFGKKQRRFAAIILDPPTFSQSKTSGIFRAESDYPKLVKLALPLLVPQGVLFAATNAATLKPEQFLSMLERAIASGGRRIAARHYVPQPPDFPINRQEPAYLKTFWLKIT